MSLSPSGMSLYPSGMSSFPSKMSLVCGSSSTTISIKTYCQLPLYKAFLCPLLVQSIRVKCPWFVLTIKKERAFYSSLFCLAGFFYSLAAPLFSPLSRAASNFFCKTFTFALSAMSCCCFAFFSICFCLFSLCSIK